MGVLVAQVTGLAVFALGTAVLGVLVRRAPSAESAESLSRISHLLFWLGLVLPWSVGVFYPGGATLDGIVGLPPLPIPYGARLFVGVPLLISGVVFMQLAIRGLKRHGHGAPALVLTRTVVDTGVYGFVRNPMALGFYVALVGGALLTGSTYVLLYTAGIIAAHAFNLRYLEEVELAHRFGDAYDAYRRRTPFLLPRPRARGPRS